jgi:hypothetical protein
MPCDHKGCELRATVNYQSGEMRWTIDSKDNYHARSSDFVADGGQNDHWCDEHDPYGGK